MDTLTNSLAENVNHLVEAGESHGWKYLGFTDSLGGHITTLILLAFSSFAHSVRDRIRCVFEQILSSAPTH